MGWDGLDLVEVVRCVACGVGGSVLGLCVCVKGHTLRTPVCFVRSSSGCLNRSDDQYFNGGWPTL